MISKLILIIKKYMLKRKNLFIIKLNENIKKVIKIILLLNLFINNTENLFSINDIDFDEYKKPNSNKWIVMTIFNIPSSFIINLA